MRFSANAAMMAAALADRNPLHSAGHESDRRSSDVSDSGNGWTIAVVRFSCHAHIDGCVRYSTRPMMSNEGGTDSRDVWVVALLMSAPADRHGSTRKRWT